METKEEIIDLEQIIKEAELRLKELSEDELTIVSGGNNNDVVFEKGMETSYSEFRYKQGRADAINPIQKFIDDYDGAIIVSENMGVINGQQLINELKEIVEQIKEQKND